MEERQGLASEDNAVAEEEAQSFRQSFYSGGTDWSCLYAVDEYGVPTNSTDAEESEQNFEFAVSDSENLNSIGDKRLNGNSINSRSQSEKVSLDGSVAVHSQNGKFSMQSGMRDYVGKLVQSDLSSFLGIKRKAASEVPSRGKRYKQQDVGMLLGISPPLERQPADATEFLSKFSRVGQTSDKKKTKDLPKGGHFGGFEENKDHVPRKCPFYKRIPGTPFTVDAFHYGEIEGCRAYFLTHFHSDHYGGLTKRWCHGPIYCTPVTARLVVMCLGVGPRWVVPLELGVGHTIQGLQVIMLEANHCPGAALILFRFPGGHQILHTGDFRACKDMQNYPQLMSGQISTLYLDTTYCNERYRFPLQKEVINFVIKQTSLALKKNSKTLVVVGSYSIGKERVYVSLAESLEVPIFADSHRRRVLKAIEWPALEARLSTDPGSTLLHVLPLSNLNFQRLKAYLQKHHPKYTAVLAFRPTGWTYSPKLGEKLEFLRPQCNGPITIYGVPYSEHSSFTELRDFVQFLRPGKIIPTVNNAKEQQRERMGATFRQWLR